MPLNEGFERVLNEDQAASQEDFTKHSLAGFIRGDLRDEVAMATGENGRLKDVAGSRYPNQIKV